jgi:hypothetical protein
LIKTFAKIHKTLNGEVLACCDKELAGKTLIEGEICFEVRESFFKGFKVSEEKLAELLKNAENANIVGKKTINAALKQDLISKSSIKFIQKIPHALIFKI